jgi:hypothetical protein
MTWRIFNSLRHQNIVISAKSRNQSKNEGQKDRKANRLREPKAASEREASEGQSAGQGSAENAADISELSERASAGVWVEIPGAALWREIRGGGTLCGRGLR